MKTKENIDKIYGNDYLYKERDSHFIYNKIFI